jgi:hypothetical protein
MCSGKRNIHFSFVFWDTGPPLHIIFEYGEKLRADGVHFSLKETRKPISHGNTHPMGQMNGSLFNLIIPSLGNLDSRFPDVYSRKTAIATLFAISEPTLRETQKSHFAHQ